ncbi:MAG: hypothetical protein D3M94_22280 [Rhodocyclales bacterium GT-UBC]|nr:MAG: hypothetical protein D3M94_22280 [Rhodocyclales bacterium GT-UBC]
MGQKRFPQLIKQREFLVVLARQPRRLIVQGVETIVGKRGDPIAVGAIAGRREDAGREAGVVV